MLNTSVIKQLISNGLAGTKSPMLQNHTNVATIVILEFPDQLEFLFSKSDAEKKLVRNSQAAFVSQFVRSRER